MWVMSSPKPQRKQHQVWAEWLSGKILLPMTQVSLDFHVDQGTYQGLEKTIVHEYWRKVAPVDQSMSLGCLFVHETKRCFQKAELGFVHAACTAFLHEGIWHLKLTCLSKPHQAPGAPKKPGLAPAMGILSCPQHWQKPRSDKNSAHPIPCWCCKAQACQWTDFDQKKERKKAERVRVDLVSFLHI